MPLESPEDRGFVGIVSGIDFLAFDARRLEVFPLELWKKNTLT